MEAHLTGQLRELNNAKLFRSGLVLYKSIGKARSDVRTWFSFRSEYLRCEHGLGHFEEVIAEGLDLVADLVEASRDGKSELSVPIPSLIAKTKLLMADACMKLKQYQNALQKYKMVAYGDHSLESMMNMAICAALVESEHSAARIYVEILIRWPYAFEAAYELSKLSGNLEVVVSNLAQSVNDSMRERTGGDEVESVEAKIASRAWLLDIYKVMQGLIASNEETVKYVDAVNAERASETTWEVKKVESSKNAFYLGKSDCLDSIGFQLVSAQLAMYRGSYREAAKLLSNRRGAGIEILGYSLLRSNALEPLRALQADLARHWPFRWETWYVSSLREWLDKRSVVPAMELLSKAQVASPTNTIILVTRAYMNVYRVKDGLLRLMSQPDDASMTWKRMMVDAAKSAELSIRDAWALSRDPFVTNSLLHIYSLISNFIPDAKVMEMVAEVVALNPLLKRFQSHPQTFLPASSNTNPAAGSQSNKTNPASTNVTSVTHVATPRHKILARMLAMKAKLCLTKPGLTQVALEAAGHATAMDPQNAFAQCMLVLAQSQKAAHNHVRTVEELSGVLKKVDGADAEDVVRKEMLPFLEKDPELHAITEFLGQLAQRHMLDEDVIFWTEHTKIRARLAEEAEEAEEEEI
jgi:tetratricopeptide (TPR) repeat protein